MESSRAKWTSGRFKGWQNHKQLKASKCSPDTRHLQIQPEWHNTLGLPWAG